MGKGFLSSITFLLVSAGWVVGQPWSPPPPGMPSGYLPDSAQAAQLAPYAGYPPPGGGFPPPGLPPDGAAPPGCPPGAPPAAGSGGLFRPLYSRQNAFGPKAVHHPEDNAFELAQDDPSDLCDNAFMCPKCCDAIVWASAEFLLWWIDPPLPVPLVTTGPVTAPNPGVLGDPGTVVLFGGHDLTPQAHPGARATVGYWLQSHYLGLEASGFVLPQRSSNFSFTSDANGFPVLARPFFNVTTGMQDRQTTAFPDNFSGGITSTYSTMLWGVEANFVWNPFKETGNYPELLVGFRYADEEEHLSIAENFLILPSGVASINGLTISPGNSERVQDLFTTRNQFYGGQLGIRTRYDFGSYFYTDLMAKVGLGATHQILTISGTTTLLPTSGPPITVNGGLLALSSNIGHYSRDEFTALPEGAINFGVYITPNFRMFAGFNIFYWPNIARAGEQVDPRVNATIQPANPAFGPLVGPALPAVLFKTSDLWAYGLSVGFSVDF